jgi:DNA/RNA endonuclease YhcR with UshA esterase domain
MNILKISLSISLIGIFAIIILTNILQPKLISIQEINSKFLNKNVKIQGQIINAKSYLEKNFQVLTIKDNTGQIDITLNKILSLTNQTITIIGKVAQYNQNFQIQTNKIII